MSFTSFKTIPLALACIWISLLPETHAGTCSILAVHGANGVVGTGFGVQPVGVVARKGNGDTGADAAEFSSAANPNPACGRVPILPTDVVDIPSFVNQALIDGVPTVYSNGSIPLTVFQVNRIGGGPMTCQYSADATGNSWQPMDVTLNMPGNFGIESQQQVTMQVVATFQAGSKFTGGPNQDTGLVRCRAGQNGNCGGCFAVRMNGQVVVSGATGTPQSAPALQLNSQQMSAVMTRVINLAAQQNLVATI